MRTKRRDIAIVVVAAVIAGGIGVATAGGEGTGPVPGGMMGTSGGMMDGNSMNGGMMTGTDMEVMHNQMMSAMTGTVPTEMLARCDTVHDRMWPGTAGDAAAGTGHASHHADTSG